MTYEVLTISIYRQEKHRSGTDTPIKIFRSKDSLTAFKLKVSDLIMKELTGVDEKETVVIDVMVKEKPDEKQEPKTE